MHCLVERGSFYNLADFEANYNLNVPFTIFYCLIDAVPSAWRNKIK